MVGSNMVKKKPGIKCPNLTQPRVEATKYFWISCFAFMTIEFFKISL